MTFGKKLGLSNGNHEGILVKLILELIYNDWKHISTLN